MPLQPSSTAPVSAHSGAPVPTHLSVSPEHNGRSAWRIITLWFVIALGLLVSFWVQYPTSRVADWSQFSFWDPGAVLKADALLGRGMIPTIDFGYTHGLIPLVYGRVGFALMGRTPGAYFVMTLLAELGMAWGMARILVALKAGWWPWMVFVAAIPLAVMPAYLTLAHPLEAMLILLALAAQAEGRRPYALALLTACLFVKPSMAYVYGLVMVVLIVVQTWRRGKALLLAMAPAVITFVALFLALAMRFGARAVVNTLIPLTGAKTYAATGFGFFAEEGRRFWVSGNLGIYWRTPAGIFLFAAIAIVVAAIFFLPGMVRSIRGVVEGDASRRGEILVTVAVLHTAFLLGFYGWTGSWTYYSYLPVLGLVILLAMIPLRWYVRAGVAAGLIVWLVCSQTRLAGEVDLAWKDKVRAGNGLYVYASEMKEWREDLRAVGADGARGARGGLYPSRGGGGLSGRTVVMTIGFIPDLPSGVEMMEAWFPEPGIPTASEVARVKKQVAGAEYVILWKQYGRFDLWRSAEFKGEREEFAVASEGEFFVVLKRTGRQRREDSRRG